MWYRPAAFLPAVRYTETRRGVGIDTAHPVDDASTGLAVAVRRARAFSPLGPLRRLLSRLDPGDAAAYEEAAREAFKAGTPTDAGKPAPSVEAADFAGSRDVRLPGSFGERVRRQGTTTGKRPGRPGSQPTEEPPEPGGATADEPATENRPPEGNSRDAADAATDPLRTPRSVTPVADDFFDGLIRRVEGKR